MKSPPRQIHDDIAFNRVEAFIRGEDNETLVGTEKAPTLTQAHAGRRAQAARARSQTVGKAERRLGRGRQVGHERR